MDARGGSGFGELLGLDGPVRVLRNALSREQLAATYLFAGPTGVGKTALAQAFARAATCPAPRRDPFDGCGACDSCKRADAAAHPEIRLVAPAGEYTQIWQFWDRPGRPSGVLSSTLQYAPVVGARRVYIVERADTLMEPAANSLLKTLEEPPRYALFVLLAPHSARVLPTILSRSQTIRLSPVPVEDLARYLCEVAEVDEARAQSLAAWSQGCTGRALRLASSPQEIARLDAALSFALTVPTARPLAALSIGERIRRLAADFGAEEAGSEVGDEQVGAGRADVGSAGGGRERMQRGAVGLVLDVLATAYRDMLAASASGADARLVHVTHRAEIVRVSATRPPDAWADDIETLTEARRRVDQMVSLTALADWLSVRLGGGPTVPGRAPAA
ncbi:MAG TPA: hypothetical protein VLH79_02725 [Chthonomonadales bacterium]|nr:hypothetical protein [Chthonomonadales bacterium]